MKRGLLIGGGVLLLLVAVIAGGAIHLLSSLDVLVRDGVETYGSEVTLARVTLDEVAIDIPGGSGALRGFKVGNPEGFSTPAAFTLGGISLAIDTASIGGDAIVIREIVVDGPDVTYEMSETGNNIDTLRRNVDAYMAKAGLKGGGETADANGEGPKLIIDDLIIRGGRVNVSASILQGRTIGAALPEIHLRDIGRDDGGASPAEVVEAVMAALTGAVGRVTDRLGVGDTLNDLQKNLGGIAEGAGKAVEGVASGAGKAVEGVAGATGGIASGAGKAVEEASGSFRKLLGN
ncbi:hypothetical protein [Oceanibacterium hippocampi]|uniref:AsmA family protein n=1 Tax=Oceanibacterium hippocampi TaxID=745714 RepID=A0A1Y5RV24_9PROT|nr:hypothetical protein [Oceanibacterium hippocampi]SLN26200.1 hypothetical protein OCH7691_00800 [Oceanibacterium hippocampi]